MRLNPDCVRDILISIEQIADGSTGFSWWRIEDFRSQEEFASLRAYSVEEVEYHVYQCKHHGFFIGAQLHSDGGFTVVDLSPTAHEFLANIRTDENWRRTKSVAQEVGSFSLSTLSGIAANVIAAIIKQQTGM